MLFERNKIYSSTRRIKKEALKMFSFEKSLSIFVVITLIGSIAQPLFAKQDFDEKLFRKSLGVIMKEYKSYDEYKLQCYRESSSLVKIGTVIFSKSQTLDNFIGEKIPDLIDTAQDELDENLRKILDKTILKEKLVEALEDTIEKFFGDEDMSIDKIRTLEKEFSKHVAEKFFDGVRLLMPERPSKGLKAWANSVGKTAGAQFISYILKHGLTYVAAKAAFIKVTATITGSLAPAIILYISFWYINFTGVGEYAIAAEEWLNNAEFAIDKLDEAIKLTEDSRSDIMEVCDISLEAIEAHKKSLEDDIKLTGWKFRGVLPLGNFRSGQELNSELKKRLIEEIKPGVESFIRTVKAMKKIIEKQRAFPISLSNLQICGQDIETNPTLDSSDLTNGEFTITGKAITASNNFSHVTMTIVPISKRAEQKSSQQSPFKIKYEPYRDIGEYLISFRAYTKDGKTYDTKQYKVTYLLPPEEAIIEFLDIRIAKTPIEEIIDVLSLTTDDLRDGQVEIKGTIDDGANGANIKRVEVDLGDGRGWQQATGRVNWSYKFRPREKFEYRLRYRAIDLADKAHESIFGPTRVVYQHARDEDLIRQVLYGAEHAWQDEDLNRFMSYFTEDFVDSANGRDWNGWRDSTKNEFDRYENINVTLSDIDISVAGNTARLSFIVEFRQIRSTTKASAYTKERSVCRFEKINGVWKWAELITSKVIEKW